MCERVPIPQVMHFEYFTFQAVGCPMIGVMFRIGHKPNSNKSLKTLSMVRLYMSKDSGVNPVFPHVATNRNSAATVPLRGVENPGSPTARLEVSDTGRESWAYDLPFIPLNVPQFADFGRILSLFELIKKHHVDTFDSDTAYDSGQKQVEDFDATDIIANKGFTLRANSANTGDIYITNSSKPYVIGASTTYGGNSISGTVTGSRILKDVSAPTNTSSYLSTGANAYPGMPLSAGDAFFVTMTRASNIYLIPTAAGCKLHWFPE